MKVFITVDTEVWPQAHGWPHTPLPSDAECRRELESYFWGGDTATKLGLPFQLETLATFGLRATFFVDPLFSFALGKEPLQRVVQAITTAQQEVGLHLHPEWLTDPRMPSLPAFRGPYMRDYDESSQSELIGKGLERLAAAGAPKVRTFRAGSWGADLATLRSLVRHGITVDSSLNACYDASLADLPRRKELLQPAFTEGVWEFPMTYFNDRPPTGRRELQVCACSVNEFEHVLETAHAQGWSCVVIVTHSFEFVRVNNLQRPTASIGPMRLLGKRFHALCKYLACNSDRFQTMTLGDATPDSLTRPVQPRPVLSNRGRTYARLVSQALSTVY